MSKQYKVETKGSLWEVCISHGAYSDFNQDFFIFAGNSAEEIWSYIKIWAKEVKHYSALIWGEKRELIYKPSYIDDEIDWSTDYGEAYDVEIKRLNVIYVNPLPPTQDINSGE